MTLGLKVFQIQVGWQWRQTFRFGTLCGAHGGRMMDKLRCFMLTTHKKQAKKKAFYLPLAEVVASQWPCTTAESSPHT